MFREHLLLPRSPASSILNPTRRLASSYTDSLDRIETSPLHAMGQLASFITSRSGAFTFQGSQACIMTSSSHVPALLAGDSPYSKENPLWTSSRDENEIPDLEILPLPLRYHCSLDVSSIPYSSRIISSG